MNFKRIGYTAALMAIMISGCDYLKDREYQSNAAPKKIAYLFLVDKIDSALINGLKEQFYERLCDSIKRPLTEAQPFGIGLVSFSIFSAQNYSLPVAVSFSATDDDMDQRSQKADIFISSLEKMKKSGENVHDKNILNNMNQLLDEIRDTSIHYKIIVLSNLLESSGGPIIKNSSGPEQWQNGNFRFVNNEGDFEPKEFDEAKRQLTDTASWINRHLIKMTATGKLYKKCRVTWMIDRKSMLDLNNTVQGRDYKEITDFWDQLFKRMGIPAEETNIPNFNVRDYHFFDISDHSKG